MNDCPAGMARLASWRIGLLLMPLVSVAVLWSSSQRAEGQEGGDPAAGKRLAETWSSSPCRRPGIAKRHQHQRPNFRRGRSYDVDNANVTGSISADAPRRDARSAFKSGRDSRSRCVYTEPPTQMTNGLHLD